MKKILLTTTPLFIYALTSCHPPNPYEGKPIPLSEALISISKGMQAADKASGGGKSTGLVPAKATVAFNVVNTSKSSQGLTLEVVPVAGLTAGGTLGREYTQQGTSAISLEYSSLLLASKDSIVGNKSPEELAKLIAMLQKEITVLRKTATQLSQDNMELKSDLKSQLKELKLLQKAEETR